MQMKLSTKKILVLLVLCLVIGASSCATTAACGRPGGDPAADRQCLYKSYERQLKTAIAAYEETMIAAGAAAERHLITETQLAAVRAAGLRARNALVSARSALALAIDVGPGGNPWAAVADANVALAALIAAASKEGVAR